MSSISSTAGKIFRVCFVVWLLGSSQAFPQFGSESMSIIAVETNRIRGDTSSVTRTEDARRLAQWVREHAGIADSADVDLLASLLADKDDSVRYWAAMSLGYIGPSAQSAVPALEKALEDRRCDHASKTSASAILFALKNMGVTPKKADC